MAYIIARPLDPGYLTKSQVDSIISCAPALSPVKEHIELIKREHQADDVWELIRHLKILVKDSAKKVQMSNVRQRAERKGRGDIAELPSKTYPSLFCYTRTNRCCQCLIPIGTAHIRREQ